MLHCCIFSGVKIFFKAAQNFLIVSMKNTEKIAKSLQVQKSEKKQQHTFVFVFVFSSGGPKNKKPSADDIFKRLK